MIEKKQIKPDMTFPDFSDNQNLNYEFELKVRLPDWIRLMLKEDRAEKVERFSTGGIFDKAVVDKFAKATSFLPGHVFFALKVKENDSVLTEKQIGFSYERNPEKGKPLPKGIGVHGFVQDQEVKDGVEGGIYNFTKSFKISKENFDNLVKFINKNIDNPPRYVWPLAYNCVRFAKKAAGVAGIRNAHLMGVTNLPMATVFYIKAMKLAEKLKKSSAKIDKLFSKERKVVLPERSSSPADIKNIKANQR